MVLKMMTMMDYQTMRVIIVTRRLEAGLSLRAGGQGFPLAIMSVATTLATYIGKL